MIKTTKILITGGHLTPALATIDYLIKHYPQYEIIFSGREIAQSQTGQLSREKQEIARRNLKFINFQATKSDNFSLITLFSSLKQAKEILVNEKIDLLLSFGGYLALPFALAAKQLAIPIITHEQTRVFGKANRLIAFLADSIAVSFPEMLKPGDCRYQYTGNPLRAQLFAPTSKPAWFSDRSSLPIIYLSGGSQGSQTLNRQLLNILSPLVKDFIIIHQHGSDSHAYKPSEEINNVLQADEQLATNYYHREFLLVEELAYFYPRLRLAIARAGANTVAELSAFAIPTIYVPLPQANYGEQEKNALALVKKQAAMIIPQDELSNLTLLENIFLLNEKAESYKQQLGKLACDLHGSERLAKLIMRTLEATVNAKTRVKKAPYWSKMSVSLNKWKSKLLNKLNLPTNSASQKNSHQPLAKSRLKNSPTDKKEKQV